MKKRDCLVSNYRSVVYEDGNEDGKMVPGREKMIPLSFLIVIVNGTPSCTHV